MTVLHMSARLLRRGAAGLLALLLGVAALELTNPLVAKSLGGPHLLAPFLETLPPAFLALAQVQPEFLTMAGLAGFLSLGFTHPLYLVLTSTAMVGFACRSLAGELERGTIQLALARPVSRPNVYAARVIGVLVVALALSAVGPLGMILGLGVAQLEDSLNYSHFFPTALATLFFFWSIGGIALLGSAAADTTGRAVAWATAALIIFYFIDYFVALWSILEPLEPFSIFTYYQPAEALVNGVLPLQNVVTLSLIGLAGAIGGLIIFTRRDLPT